MTDSCKHHGTVCTFKARLGEDKCILHSDDPEKDTEKFKEALSLHRSDCGEDFRFMVFPGEIDFREETFEEKCRFDGAVFKDRVLFMDANFEEDANFRRAIFEGEAFFMDSDFYKKADFWKATFEKKVDFSNSSYEEEHRRGRTISNFESADFHEETVFCDSTFKQVANFSEVNFWDGACFREAVFEGDSSFWHTTFDGWTSFLKSDFRKWVSFEFSHFTRSSFVGSTFERGTSFECAFQKGNQIQFEEVNFTGCKFGGDALFAGDKYSEQVFEDGEVKFKDVTLLEDATLQFRYADLSHCQFLRTDLRSASFTGIEWCDEFSVEGWITSDWFRDKYDGGFTTRSFRRKNEWFRRVGLYDELSEGSSSDETESSEKKTRRWHEVERLYRQLKRNYEERGDFPRGGDFHIGEKEARSRGETRPGPFFLLTAYRTLSKYGERALPAFFWLVGLILGFALLYRGATVCPLCEPLSYSEALIPSLEATFYPVQSVDFEEYWVNVFSFVQRIFSPILIALFALALRQRVKR